MGDGELGAEAAVSPGAEVGDVRGGQVRVGDRQERVVEPANPRAPQADRLDDSLVRADLDQVSDPERAVGDEHQRAEEVLERVLRGQGDREAADPQAGEDRPDVEAEQLEHRGQPEDGHQDLEDQRHHREPHRREGRRPCRVTAGPATSFRIGSINW